MCVVARLFLCCAWRGAYRATWCGIARGEARGITYSTVCGVWHLAFHVCSIWCGIWHGMWCVVYGMACGMKPGM